MLQKRNREDSGAMKGAVLLQAKRILRKVLAKKRHEAVSKEAISCCLIPVVFKKIGL